MTLRQTSDQPAEELPYLRTQLDEVGSENLRLTARIQVAQRELELRRRGFTLMASLGRTLGAHTELEPAVASVLPTVEAELQVQRTVALRREGAAYTPFAWTGYRGTAAAGLEGAQIQFPARLDEEDGLLVTADEPEQPWLRRARAALGVPAFVAVPIRGLEHILVTGRLAERAGFFPRFDAVDVDTLKAVADLVAAAVENTQLAALGEVKRFLPPAVVDELMSGRLVPQQGYGRQEVTVLAADLVGFTTLADRLAPDTLADVLNAYLHEMTTLANAHGGTVGSIAGDGMIVLFGAPEPSEPEEQARAAGRAAFAMQGRVARLRGGGDALALRIGINTGSCAVGAFGSDAQRTYTAIGLPVNLAARLEAAAAPGEILVSPHTLHLLGEAVQASAREQLSLKGIAEPVTAYAIAAR